MERIVNDAKHQINLLWWGSESLPVKEALDENRLAGGPQDSFIFARTLEEVTTALSAPGCAVNALFINMPPSEAKPLFDRHRSLVTEAMLIVVPAPYVEFTDKAIVGRFNIKPYFFFEPEQALRNLPAFLERQLVAARKETQR